MQGGRRPPPQPRLRRPAADGCLEKLLRRDAAATDHNGAGWSPRTLLALRHKPVSYLPHPPGMGWLRFAMTDDVEIPAADATPGRVAPGEVGLVTPHDFVYKQPFTFKSGQMIPEFTLRYETYGTLNATRDNAVLICHALSGDHHCAGWHSTDER